MPNKTPQEDFDRFEKFIDAMEDIEFEYWYANEASAKQKKLANEIREEATWEDVEREFDTPRGLFSWLESRT